MRSWRTAEGDAGIRIDLLIRSLGTGGAERQMVTLAAALAERRHDVRVLTFYAGGARADDALNGGVAIVPLGKRGRWDLWRFRARLTRELRVRRPDVLYAMLPGANVSAALVRPRRFGAALVMGVRASRMALRHYDLATRAAYAIEARLAQRADAVIANSQAGRDAAEARGFPAARIHVVANGIDAARFRPDAAERATWRQRLTIAPGAPVIGMVARFDPMKAHDVFLEAAARLHATRPDVRFILAGAGVHSSNPTIVDAIGRLGLGRSVTLVGEQAHVESLYPSFDIATLSSRFGEGFPNVLAEAMASELPCVATDVGDSRALIGATGRIVPPGDADALAAAWLELLQLDTGARTALGRAAREFVMARHGVARLAEETEAVLRKAVA